MFRCLLLSIYLTTMSATDTPNILIIDDDRLHLTLYAWILGRQGYRCQTALVGSSSVDLSGVDLPAADMPANGAVDLVLLDYRLNSSVTAVEIARDLRKRLGSIPIVVLSEVEWMPDDMRGHAAAFVHKGDPKFLLDTVAATLQGKDSEGKSSQ